MKATEVKVMQREFVIKETGTVVPDPNPYLSPDEVLDFLSATYPSLVTATVKGPEIREDKLRYTFTTVLGTKG
ncbi:MAG: PRTRC system protein C [Clostridium sp.]|nr:PRTRC system protein C [Clostridium sp.]